MKFLFQAKSSSGEVVKGKIDATNTEAATLLLQEKGFVPLKIELESATPNLMKEIQHLWEGVSLRELSVFFRQLSTLIDAKVSIVGSLNAVGNQTENVYFKMVISEMVSDIQDGLPFSEAMAKHPEVFESLAVSMVKAGELSGNLQRSVLFLAENNEKNYELNSKIKSALFYPVFVLVAASAIGFIVATVVLPKLTGIFKDMNVAIPWYTQALMTVGSFMSSYWWLVIIIIIGIVGSLVYYVKTSDGKKEWDMIKMKIPVIGNLFQYVYIARFSENLSVLLDGGIPIVRALIIVSEVVNSSAYAEVILKAGDEVKTGGTMSSVFARSTYFPPIVSQMIKIGEESGKVSEVLQNTASFYSQETDRITRNLSAMLEPIMITFLGVGVGFLVFAILMPIYNIAGSM
ncbi:MAG: type II secretion system F family protein [Candidatus Moranbacteria bacterium]|nr:type II secretion system F family protein [Candidatus Moranbacteria bacterium]